LQYWSNVRPIRCQVRKSLQKIIVW